MRVPHEEHMTVEILGLIVAVIKFVIALLKQGKKAETIIHLTSSKFDIPKEGISAIINKLK